MESYWSVSLKKNQPQGLTQGKSLLSLRLFLNLQVPRLLIRLVNSRLKTAGLKKAPVLGSYLALAYFQLGEYRETLKILDEINDDSPLRKEEYGQKDIVITLWEILLWQ